MAAVTLVVLAGAGLWVHQQVTSPNPPDCATNWSAGPADRSAPSTPGTELWHGARTAVTAPITGIAYRYTDTNGGGLCSTQSVTVAFVPSAASDTAMTVGDVFVTGLREKQAQDIAEHESRHVSQWAALTLVAGPLALPALYGLDDALFPGARNHFERAAGLRDGNYPKPKELGPRPHWGKVTGVGLLLTLLLWRRLRWLSRALFLGRAGAGYREPGRCRVHSRGWVELGT